MMVMTSQLHRPVLVLFKDILPLPSKIWGLTWELYKNS